MTKWTLVTLMGVAMMATGCGGEDRPATVAVTFDLSDPVLAFAAEDIERAALAGGAGVVGKGVDAGWTFELRVDPSIPPYHFAAEGSGGRVVCRGADSTTVLHAVYAALEQAGVLFDVTGPTVPARLRLERLDGWSVEVAPVVERRAIRQHLNFPMDITSYSLPEAMAYIRNLARLRFNRIVFHSYPGNWYTLDRPKKPYLAGEFFYGIRYDIPDEPLFRRAIRNEAVFCIPEIEPVYDDPVERGRRAIAWLGAVMAEARRVGLEVWFSFEMRASSVEEALATARSVLASYPDVQGLEIITPETLGRWEDPVPAEALREPMAAAIRGEDAPGLPGMLRLVASNIRAAQALREELDEACPKLSIAVYCPVKPLHQAAIPLLREFVPADMEWAILPAHGTRAVADCLAEAPLEPEDWRRATMYSWIEFDGSMYLQQNPVEGLRRLVALGGDDVTSVGLNHWRTAENRTAFRYAARALVEGPIDPDAFYHEYAARLGVGRPDDYAGAMARLDEVDTMVRDRLFNIGFCYYGVWGRSGLGKIGRLDPAAIDAAQGEFAGVLEGLGRCHMATEAPAGRAYLGFLENRINCTMLHLAAMRRMTALQPICGEKSPGDLSDDERAAVRKTCDEALAITRAYETTHAEMLPDRGCEGTLINYRDVVPRQIRRIRDEYAPEEKPGTEAAAERQ